jgi:site-specific recombinase XerD
MTSLAPTLQTFFTDRLVRQRRVSPRTIDAYRDTLRLLVCYAAAQKVTEPSRLDIADLDATMVAGFLDHLEADRGNSVRTRNARLGAIRSFFRHAALCHPEHADHIARVLAIPQKRFDKKTVSFLTQVEIQALLDAPNPNRWEGRRDKVLLAVAIQTGLRVSELVGLNCGDISLNVGAHLRCDGKGRKLRAVPLTTATVTLLRSWTQERGGLADEPLLPTRTGRRLSRDAVERRLAVHVHQAAQTCPSLHDKQISAHTLRHSCAMALLAAGVDTSVIALWLGHEDVRSTQIYLHADLTIKERALALVAPASVKPGRYRPPDAILAFLQSL